MNNLIPIQKAKQLGIHNIDIMNIFPTIILQDFYKEGSAIHHSKKS